MLIIITLLLLGAGVWFYRLGGPAQLELADRWWPGKAEFTGLTAKASPSYDVYFPVTAGKGDGLDCDAQKHPTLIFFYGGSWRDGDRQSYGFVGRAFAARGFVTYVADYRKAPKHRFPVFITDAAKVIAQVHKSPCTDPDRLFIMGHSAGAHIATMVALDPQWLAAEGLNPDTITGVIGLAGPYDFYPFTSEPARDALGQWPRPEETQPIHYARGDAPPLLLLHGEIDATVKPRNSVRLAEAIAAKGGAAASKIYSSIDHADIVMAVARPFRKKAAVIDDVVAFTQRVGGKT